MLVTIISEDVGEVIINLCDNKNFSQKLRDSLPFKAKAIVWKEEVYFETPIKADIESETIRVKKGDVAYWPPGRAMCLFYGVSQPYSPVEIVGEILGPTYYLRSVRDGSNIEVQVYKERNHPLINTLSKAGLTAALRQSEDGYISIVTNLKIGGELLGVELYPEEYGIAIESDGFFKYDLSTGAQICVRKFKELIEKSIKSIRFDINEDNYLCLTTYVKDANEVISKLRDMERAYDILVKYL